MAEENKKDTPQKQEAPVNNDATKQDEAMHVRNPFTGKDVEVTQEQLDNIEKGIEAQTERD